MHVRQVEHGQMAPKKHAAGLHRARENVPAPLDHRQHRERAPDRHPGAHQNEWNAMKVPRVELIVQTPRTQYTEKIGREYHRSDPLVCQLQSSPPLDSPRDCSPRDCSPDTHLAALFLEEHSNGVPRATLLQEPLSIGKRPQQPQVQQHHEDGKLLGQEHLLRDKPNTRTSKYE